MRTAKESKGNTVLKFLCRHWYNLGLIPGAVAASVLVFCWNSLGTLVKINLFSFIAIILHQFEEYGWPGVLLPWVIRCIAAAGCLRPCRSCWEALTSRTDIR